MKRPGIPVRCLAWAMVILTMPAACTQAMPTPTPTATATPTPIPTATPTPSPTPTPYVNACAMSGPPPTPTLMRPRPTPTPTPTVTPGGPPIDLETPPRIEVPPLPGIPVPDKAESLVDALVSIVIHRPDYAGSYVPRADGLIVSADGLVLTVLDYSEPMDRLEIQVPGRGRFDATIERVDPRTGATLLRIDAAGLPFASLGDSATVGLGEPVVLLHRDEETGYLEVWEGYGAPATNEGSRDTLFALLPMGSIGRHGSVVLNRDGGLLGMAGQWTWWGTSYSSSGPAPGPARPAVKTDSLRQLLDEHVGEDMASIPAAVSYHAIPATWQIDSPVTRGLLAEPARNAMESLEGVAEGVNVGRKDDDVLRGKPGHILELVFVQPQELRSQFGELLGEARYVAFWWGRENGEPDVVLCGAEPGYICGAFLAGDLSELKAVLEAAPGSGRSMVASDAYSMPGYPYRYPLEWDVTSNEESYHPGEEVTFMVTIENHSDWPVTAHHLPPAIQVRSKGTLGLWWQQEAGTESRVIPPHETTTVEISWQQVDREGSAMPPGDYGVEVNWRNARGSTLGAGGDFTILWE